MNAVIRFGVWLVSLIAGAWLIRVAGNWTVPHLVGYEQGNRRRTVSVLSMEWVMAHISILIYLHLFSYFQHSPNGHKWSNAGAGAQKFRQRALWLFWFVMLGTHVAYLFYLVDFVVPSVLYDVALFCVGLWMHLAFFSVGFLFVGMIVDVVGLCSIGQSVLSVLFRCRPLRRLASDRQFQVVVSLSLTLILSLFQYLSSDRLVVREAEFSITKWPSTTAPMRFALITDLHAGAGVYSDQIAKVVERVNAEHPDAVFLVGDTVDAPRSLIEDRVRPLKYLHSPHGSLIVTGNHEYYYGDWNEWSRLFSHSYGMTVLENENATVGPACIVGLNDISANRSGIAAHQMNAVAALQRCATDQPIIVLAHNPAATPKIMAAANATGKHVDLILSGHTHAGQYYVVAPVVYWLLPYFYGVYPLNAGATHLLVSAGTLYQASPMKMWRMSEIWMITIKGA